MGDTKTTTTMDSAQESAMLSRKKSITYSLFVWGKHTIYIEEIETKCFQTQIWLLINTVCTKKMEQNKKHRWKNTIASELKRSVDHRILKYENISKGPELHPFHQHIGVMVEL